MSRNDPKLYAALVVACLALGLSIHTAIRSADRVSSTVAHATDQEARDQIASLRRALAERDAVIARLARAANAAGSSSNTGAPSPAEPKVEQREAKSERLEADRRRYAHFETPNPAVSVTQRDDGSFDIRTTDPALAGTVMQITAVRLTGEEDKVFIRIPQ